MAATKRNPMKIQKTRDAVRASQLMNRLEDHGFGKVSLEPTQVKAIEIVLKKLRPDLSSTTLDATDGYKQAMAGIKVTFGG